MAAPMRILVTGPTNPVGAALVRAVASAGHEVRAFGVPAGEDPFAGMANVSVFPGWVKVGGSIEPVASECQAVIHAAPLDAPGEDAKAHAVHIEKGTLYARYAAERELVQLFAALLPADAPRAFSKAVAQAKAHVQATRRLVPHLLLEVADPALAVREVMAALSIIPGDEAAAVTTADAAA